MKASKTVLTTLALTAATSTAGMTNGEKASAVARKSNA